MAKKKNKQDPLFGTVNLTQIVLGLLLTLVAYNGSQMNSKLEIVSVKASQIENNQNVQKAENHYIKEKISIIDLKSQSNFEKLQIKRFTQNNFDIEIASRDKAINFNSEEIKSINKKNATNTTKILKLELMLDNLKNEKK